MIRAIFFDVGGTIHNHSASDENDIKFFNDLRYYIEKNEIAHISDTLYLKKSVDRGRRKYRDYSEKTRIELSTFEIWKYYFLSDFSLNQENLLAHSEMLMNFYDKNRKVLRKKEDLNDVISKLYEMGLYLGVISNIMSLSFVPDILKEYKVYEYFSEIILSSKCGIRKPDRRIFDLALEKSGFDKNDVIYVGDTLSRDVKGCRNAGWKIIQIDNPYTYHKDIETKKLGYKADFFIKELSEIPDIIKSINI